MREELKNPVIHLRTDQHKPYVGLCFNTLAWPVHYTLIVQRWCWQARIIEVQPYPCGQSAASEAKAVRNNVLWKGSPIPLGPRGKPLVFRSDTHGQTEVREGVDVGKLVCASDLVVDTTAITAHQHSAMLDGEATAGSMGVLTTHHAVH